jgi:alpha-amylase
MLFPEYIFSQRLKNPVLVLSIFLFMASLAPGVFAQNGVMMQYFHWYYPAGGLLWDEVANQTDELASAGITALWLPPAYKGASQNDVGYGVYDLYDLGEFDQKGTIPTKYGTKNQYLNAVAAAHRAGIQIYADVVFNHKMGADFTEKVTAVRVAADNRNHEYGGDIWINAWTGFDFTKRSDKYSTFKWRWYHFDGTDWAADLRETGKIYKFRGIGKAWDREVDTEYHNYDYLMGADVDFGHPDVRDELEQWGRWVVAHTGIDGFRIDAVKHIEYNFFKEWLEHVRTATGRQLFAVGEFWSGNIAKLHNYIAKTGGIMSLFDAPLHYNFHAASKADGTYDMSKLMDNTLIGEQPLLAVTLVENHDTQPCQALESPVEDWFKPLAYAFILLRQEGYPNIFYADYFGAHYKSSDNKCGKAPGGESRIRMVSHKLLIDKFLAARKKYAHGPQKNYLNHWDIIGWTRLGDPMHPGSMAAIMSDGPGGVKWMDTGKPDTVYIDITGHRIEPVSTNQDGWGQFAVNSGSVSVWVEQSSLGAEDQEVVAAFACHNGKTLWGQNVYVVGSIPELGDWDTDEARILGSKNYPVWEDTLTHLPPDTYIEWKCIKKDGAGNVVWQPGSNNKFTSPTSGTGITSGSF